VNELRRCDLCEKPFVADEGWKRKCLLCWKEENSYTKGKGDTAFELMRDAYVELEEGVTEAVGAAEERAAAAEAEAARVKAKASRVVRAYKAAKKALSEVQEPEGQPLSAAQVKALIHLCHPDKHGGSEKATEVTKWLLALRDKD
jgi:hypothetical protein